MTEHESRKCNERSGFVLSTLNIKAAFVENEIQTKISVTCQAKGHPMACVFQKTNFVSEIPKEESLLPKMVDVKLIHD